MLMVGRGAPPDINGGGGPPPSLDSPSTSHACHAHRTLPVQSAVAAFVTAVAVQPYTLSPVGRRRIRHGSRRSVTVVVVVSSRVRTLYRARRVESQSL